MHYGQTIPLILPAVPIYQCEFPPFSRMLNLLSPCSLYLSNSMEATLHFPRNIWQIWGIFWLQVFLPKTLFVQKWSTSLVIKKGFSVWFYPTFTAYPIEFWRRKFIQKKRPHFTAKLQSNKTYPKKSYKDHNWLQLHRTYCSSFRPVANLALWINHQTS